MKLSLQALTLAFAISVIPHFSTAADWYRWRGPDQNGISQETDWQASWPAAGPKIVWKTSVGIGFSSFAVANGRVYTMGNARDTDTVWCLDATSGDVIWKHSYACKLDPNLYEGGPNATPTVDGNRVYTLSKEGHFICLNSANGEVVWSKHLANEFSLKKPDWGFSGSPLVLGDLVILNAGEAGIAFNKASGEKVWGSEAGPGGYSTPLPFQLNGQQALALFSEKDLIALNPADGKELWRFPWKTRYGVNAAEPIVAGDRMFISSGYNQGSALLQVSGDEAKAVWQNKNMRNQLNSSVVWESNIYGVDDKELRCMDLATGAVRWSDNASGKGSLLLANGKLIVLSEKGELMVADASPSAFKLISRAQILGGRCWTVPVLSNSRLYARNAKGDVVCLDLSAK